MKSEVRRVQAAYPQIYLACHTRHVRGERSGHELTSREVAILSHLDEHEPRAPGALAKHFGITLGTLSVAVDALVETGHVRRERRSDDRRRVDLYLTQKGAEAMEASSVLDAAAVERVLQNLKAAKRAEAIAGLELLAKAATAAVEREGAGRTPVRESGRKARRSPYP